MEKMEAISKFLNSASFPRIFHDLQKAKNILELLKYHVNEHRKQRKCAYIFVNISLICSGEFCFIHFELHVKSLHPHSVLMVLLTLSTLLSIIFFFS